MYEQELMVAKEIAREAGIIMLQYFDGDQHVTIKADNSQVTVADTLINSLVIKRLGEQFPDDGVIGEEESTTTYGLGRKWFCDPIDGTAAYVRGLPMAMFSLALVIDGRPVLGVTYDPFLDRLYTGVAGEPSTCNDMTIRVSTEDIHTGTIALSSRLRSLSQTTYFNRMVSNGVKLTALSGAVYKSCLVARGKFIGYAEHGVNGHDMAAVQVILEGAGGKITAIDGQPLDYSRPFQGAIVSNSLVHDQLIAYCA